MHRFVGDLGERAQSFAKTRYRALICSREKIRFLQAAIPPRDPFKTIAKSTADRDLLFYKTALRLMNRSDTALIGRGTLVRRARDKGLDLHPPPPP